MSDKGKNKCNDNKWTGTWNIEFQLYIINFINSYEQEKQDLFAFFANSWSWRPVRKHHLWLNVAA